MAKLARVRACASMTFFLYRAAHDFSAVEPPSISLHAILCVLAVHECNFLVKHSNVQHAA